MRSPPALKRVQLAGLALRVWMRASRAAATEPWARDDQAGLVCMHHGDNSGQTNLC